MDKVVSRNPNIYILSRLSCCLGGAALQLLDVLLLVDGVDLPCRISYSVVHQTMKFPQHIVSPPWDRLGEQHGRCFRSKWDQEAFPAQLPWNALVALAVSFILSKRSGFKNSLISTKKNPSFLIVSRNLKGGREGGKESCANSGRLLPGMQDFAVLQLFSITCFFYIRVILLIHLCVSDKHCTGDGSVLIKHTFRFSQLSLVRIFRKRLQSISTCQYASPKSLSQRSCCCFVPNFHEPHAAGGTTSYLE